MNNAALNPNEVLKQKLFASVEPDFTEEPGSLNAEYLKKRSEAKAVAEMREIKTPHAVDPNLLLFEKTPLHVRFASYTGPLDLLLDLIKANEMDIYDIPIADITQQYMDSITAMKELDLEVAGEFLVMAATLLYIKSKMLLPIEDPFEDDEDQDPRAELVRKLIEYQAFKEAAKELGILEGERGKTFTRQISDYYLSDLDPEDVGIDTFSASLYDLLSAFQKVLTQAKKEVSHEVFEEEISIEDKIEEMKVRLAQSKRMHFSQFFGTQWTKNLLIVTFLAVLELVRMKFAVVKQDDSFSEIYIEKKETVEIS